MGNEEKKKEIINQLSTKICSIAITATLLLIFIAALIVIIVLIFITVTTTTNQNNQKLRLPKRSLENGDNEKNTTTGSKRQLSKYDIDTIQNFLHSPSGELFKSILLDKINATLGNKTYVKGNLTQNILDTISNKSVDNNEEITKEDSRADFTQKAISVEGDTLSVYNGTKTSPDNTIQALLGDSVLKNKDGKLIDNKRYAPTKDSYANSAHREYMYSNNETFGNTKNSSIENHRAIKEDGKADLNQKVISIKDDNKFNGYNRSEAITDQSEAITDQSEAITDKVIQGLLDESILMNKDGKLIDNENRAPVVDKHANSSQKELLNSDNLDSTKNSSSSIEKHGANINNVIDVLLDERALKNENEKSLDKNHAPAGVDNEKTGLKTNHTIHTQAEPLHRNSKTSDTQGASEDQLDNFKEKKHEFRVQTSVSDDNGTNSSKHNNTNFTQEKFLNKSSETSDGNKNGASQDQLDDVKQKKHYKIRSSASYDIVKNGPKHDNTNFVQENSLNKSSETLDKDAVSENQSESFKQKKDDYDIQYIASNDIVKNSLKQIIQEYMIQSSASDNEDKDISHNDKTGSRTNSTNHTKAEPLHRNSKASDTKGASENQLDIFKEKKHEFRTQTSVSDDNGTNSSKHHNTDLTQRKILNKSNETLKENGSSKNQLDSLKQKKHEYSIQSIASDDIVESSTKHITTNLTQEKFLNKNNETLNGDKNGANEDQLDRLTQIIQEYMNQSNASKDEDKDISLADNNTNYTQGDISNKGNEKLGENSLFEVHGDRIAEEKHKHDTQSFVPNKIDVQNKTIHFTQGKNISVINNKPSHTQEGHLNARIETVHENGSIENQRHGFKQMEKGNRTSYQSSVSDDNGFLNSQSTDFPKERLLNRGNHTFDESLYAGHHSSFDKDEEKNRIQPNTSKNGLKVDKNFNSTKGTFSGLIKNTSNATKNGFTEATDLLTQKDFPFNRKYDKHGTNSFSEETLRKNVHLNVTVKTPEETLRKNVRLNVSVKAPEETLRKNVRLNVSAKASGETLPKNVRLNVSAKANNIEGIKGVNVKKISLQDGISRNYTNGTVNNENDIVHEKKFAKHIPIRENGDNKSFSIEGDKLNFTRKELMQSESMNNRVKNNADHTKNNRNNTTQKVLENSDLFQEDRVGDLTVTNLEDLLKSKDSFAVMIDDSLHSGLMKNYTDSTRKNGHYVTSKKIVKNNSLQDGTVVDSYTDSTVDELLNSKDSFSLMIETVKDGNENDIKKSAENRYSDVLKMIDKSENLDVVANSDNGPGTIKNSFNDKRKTSNDSVDNKADFHSDSDKTKNSTSKESAEIKSSFHNDLEEKLASSHTDSANNTTKYLHNTDDSIEETIKTLQDDPLKISLENITKEVKELVHESDKNEVTKKSNQGHEKEAMYQEMISQLNSSNIRQNSYDYSKYPHEPGSKRSEEMGREMAKKWKEEYGLDKVEIFEYNVLLSFPERPAKIFLRENDDVIKTIKIINEPDFGSTRKSKDAVYPFNAYSKSGNVTGEVVYCNYGRDEDYELLVKLKVMLKERIHVIRYGLPYSRGEMMNRAMDHGAIAVIFYSDPEDYVYPGQEYPTGWMLNEYGVQRGNIGNTADYSGDLLSEGFPSKENYYRERISNIRQYQYKIPSQPLSASLAKELISFMDDYSIPFPDRFKGDVNSTYALQTSKNKTITLSIDNKFDDKKTLVVCGTLFGATEPDRYIMIGNHRDAWTYGAADPVSGSAVMTELVRVLADTKKKFRPRRSIMACSWGAEEVGMLGSIEWAEENMQFITQHVVAYINIDMAVEGNYTLQIKSLEHMAKSIFDAAKRIRSPDNENITLFQEICQKQAKLKNLTKELEEPDYTPVGTESDSMIFVQRYGIGVSDYRYIYNGLEYPMLETHNGQYHTLYDNFDWMSRFVDPTFKYHLTLGKLWLMHTLILADSAIIPLDIKTYSEQLQKSFFELEKKYFSHFRENDIATKYVRESIADLISRVIQFERITSNIDIDKLDFIQLRAINDVIAKFGHQFMLRHSSGDRALKQVYAAYTRFPGVVNAVTKNPGVGWDNVRREMTDIMWCVDLATKSLDLTELRLEGLYDSYI